MNDSESTIQIFVHEINAVSDNTSSCVYLIQSVQSSAFYTSCNSPFIKQKAQPVLKKFSRRTIEMILTALILYFKCRISLLTKQINEIQLFFKLQTVINVGKL